MNWWEETEARAHRARTPATLAEALWQRFQAAGLEVDRGFLPAYDLALLFDLCADLVKLVEGLLVLADGNRVGLRRQALLLNRWAQMAEFWTRSSASAFNQILDGLDLDPSLLLERGGGEEQEAAAMPEEQAKVDGRYRNWHLLYERLDLKLTSAELPERIHHGLARSLARLYEECLITIRVIHALEKDANPRLRGVSRLLLQLNTTWHFDLGPYLLGHGELRPLPGGGPGLQTLLLLTCQALGEAPSRT